MKKSIVFCVVVIFVLIGSGLSQATIIRGTWDLDSGIENGSWTEFFNGLGGPLQTGNQLFAGDGLQWQLATPMIVQSTGPTDAGDPPGWDYKTFLTGGVLTLGDGPWGGPVEVGLSSATILSRTITSDIPDFAIEILGSVGNLDWIVKATYPGVDSDYEMTNLFHTGDKFETIEVSAVPEPTTMFLLGFGLVGIATIRKRCRVKS